MMDLGNPNIIRNPNFMYWKTPEESFTSVDLEMKAKSGKKVDKDESKQEESKSSYMETMMHLFKGNVGPG